MRATHTLPAELVGPPLPHMKLVISRGNEYAERPRVLVVTMLCFSLRSTVFCFSPALAVSLATD